MEMPPLASPAGILPRKVPCPALHVDGMELRNRKCLLTSSPSKCSLSCRSGGRRRGWRDTRPGALTPWAAFAPLTAPAETAAKAKARGDAAASRGDHWEAANAYGAALGIADGENLEFRLSILVALAESLVELGALEDAKMVATLGLDNDDPSRVSRWHAVTRRHAAAESESAEILNRVLKGNAAPPSLMLHLLRTGLGDVSYWKKLLSPLSSALGPIAEGISVHFLGHERLISPTGGAVEVVAFPDRTFQGGCRVELRRNASAAEVACQVEKVLGAVGSSKTSIGGGSLTLRAYAGGPVVSSVSSSGMPWCCIRNDNWIQADFGAVEAPVTKRSLVAASWPRRRVFPGLIDNPCKRAPSGDPEVFKAASMHRPLVISGAHVLPGAEERWSLEYFENHIPPESSGGSLFSVYCAPADQRAFRYVRDGGAGSEYDASGEQQAERIHLSFGDFAARKRACAEGKGDGKAYYLWGLALQRTAEGRFQGCNFGDSIDNDIINGASWGLLERVQTSGSWGEVHTVQIFVGCRNALTPCHYDLTHNLYTQVKGWKRFTLLDPIYGSCLYPYPVAHPMDRCARVDLEQPDFERFPRLRTARAIEAVLGPGDALIIPAGWWHHVQTLTEDSISVSFWFSDEPLKRIGRGGPLGSLDRLLLAREAEDVLGRVLGALRVRGAFAQLRGLLGGKAPPPVQDEVTCCLWLLWRLVLALGPGTVANFVRDLADDRRFEFLKLRKS